MRLASHLRNLSRPLVEYRVILSFGLSAACGVILDRLYPFEDRNPFLLLVALERPAIFDALLWSYSLFLYSTPFLVLSILFSLAYIHLCEPRLDQVAGALPTYPDPRQRTELFLIAGEVPRRLIPEPFPAPTCLSIPERGLYTFTPASVSSMPSALARRRPSSFRQCASFSHVGRRPRAAVGRSP